LFGGATAPALLDSGGEESILPPLFQDRQMTNHTEFQSHLEAHPNDWEYRLVYADWLEEQGDPFCETQRWMAANRKRPLKFDFEMSTWSVLAFMSEAYFQDNITRHAAELELHNALVKAGEIHCALIE